MKIVQTEPRIGVVRLPHAEGLALPSYETAGAAGMDLRAAVPDDRPLLILPGKRALVPTGLILEIPDGMEGQVRPRSGLAFKHGITCLNTPGTIDSDYRGELKVLLVNLGDEDFAIRSCSRR
jgi:dUTP pyrophosphatase